MNQSVKPMQGVRVLDVATFIAAPHAASILGEFGAEVIKVENPKGGDPWRRFGTATEKPDRSLAWLTEARNKRSVTLNLRTPEGAELFKLLVKDTDVVCENFRPGRLEGWGLGWDVLKEINLDGIDYVFLDGGHKYETVRNDLENLTQIVNNKGTILCDDYNLSYAPGVKKAIDEYVIDKNYDLKIYISRFAEITKKNHNL